MWSSLRIIALSKGYRLREVRIASVELIIALEIGLNLPKLERGGNPSREPLCRLFS
jgi:hypothetical protein